MRGHWRRKSFFHAARVLGGIGGGNQIALCLVASQLGENAQLIDRFHTLGGHDKPEPVRELDDRSNDQSAVARAVDVGHKRLLDLDVGEGKVAQLQEGRIAGPEIVDRKPDPLDPEPRERIHQLDEWLRRALGEFKDDPVAWHVQSRGTCARPGQGNRDAGG